MYRLFKNNKIRWSQEFENLEEAKTKVEQDFWNEINSFNLKYPNKKTTILSTEWEQHNDRYRFYITRIEAWTPDKIERIWYESVIKM